MTADGPVDRMLDAAYNFWMDDSAGIPAMDSESQPPSVAMREG
jgi:hypothetical protein